MSITSLLTGRATALLPLPARLALTFGPRAMRAYGDWRGKKGRAAATKLGGRVPRRGAQQRGRAASRRNGFPWGVGLGGVALGALSTAAALLGGKALKEHSSRGTRTEIGSTGQTLVTRADTTTAAPVTRTVIEQPGH